MLLHPETNVFSITALPLVTLQWEGHGVATLLFKVKMFKTIKLISASCVCEYTYFLTRLFRKRVIKPRS